MAVVKYRYDAWGKPISKTGDFASTLGTVQPFRYRAYVYDEETGMYYLRSRYYNPDHCRFVNADVLYHHNLMTYAANSPVYYCDKDGYALCRAFEGCGFGNPFASLTGGVTIGGGSCGGFAAGLEAYSAAGALSILSDDQGRSEPVAKVVDAISIGIGIPVIAFASTAIATSVSIGFACLADAFAKQALTLGLGKDIAYGIKAITILCGTCIGHEAQSAFNEAFFAHEQEPLDYAEEGVRAVISAISPFELTWRMEYAINTIKAIWADDLLPEK